MPDRNYDDEEEKETGGVPGRATWVPGAPPGFHESTSQAPFVSGDDATYPRDPVASLPEASVQHSPGSRNGGRAQHLGDAKHFPQIQGMHDRQDTGFSAWDNRHKYPPGYWKTRAEGDVSTEAASHSDHFDKNTGFRGERRPGLSMTDDRDMHEGHGSGSGDGHFSPSWGSSVRVGDGRDGRRPDSSETALSGFDVIDLTTPSPSSGWRPSRGPSFPTSDISYNDDSKYKRPNSGYSDTDEQVRDSFRGHDTTTNRQPGGRGFWSSSESDRNIESPNILLSNNGDDRPYRRPYRPDDISNNRHDTTLNRPFINGGSSSVDLDINISENSEEDTSSRSRPSTQSRAPDNHLDDDTRTRTGGTYFVAGITLTTAKDVENSRGVGSRSSDDDQHRRPNSPDSAPPPGRATSPVLKKGTVCPIVHGLWWWSLQTSHFISILITAFTHSPSWEHPIFCRPGRFLWSSNLLTVTGLRQHHLKV